MQWLKRAVLAGLAAVAASGARADEVTNADWLKKPDSDAIKAVWPSGAARDGKGGKATIVCDISVSGLLENCKVASETPPGLGFGVAALLLSPSFQMKPATLNGRPVRSQATIPISFDGNGPRGDSAQTLSMVMEPVWRRAPTHADMLAAWPKGVNTKTASAHVVLRCRFTREGGLRQCETVSEEPPWGNFSYVARTLAQKGFQARVAPGEEDATANAWVTLPFDFARPGTAAAEARTLPPHPRWMRMLSPEAVEAVYPVAARRAGVRTGVATMDCLVGVNGQLGDCRVVGEMPTGLGFGDAAAKVAGIMQMSPWTEGGGPVDGGRITLPIRLTLPDDEPAQPKR